MLKKITPIILAFVLTSVIFIGSAFADSYNVTGSTVSIYQGTDVTTGDIDFPLDYPDKIFMSRLSVSDVQNGQIQWYYTPVGASLEDAEINFSTADWRTLLYNGYFFINLPEIEPVDGVLDWSNMHLVGIPFKYYFDALRIQSVQFAVNYIGGYGSFSPSFSTNYIRFQWRGINTFINTYDFGGNYIDYPEYVSDSSNEKIIYGTNYPRLAYVMITLQEMMFQYADWQINNGYDLKIMVPELYFEVFTELNTPENNYQNWKDKEIIQKIDTIDDSVNNINDTLNQTDSDLNNIEFRAGHQLIYFEEQLDKMNITTPDVEQLADVDGLIISSISDPTFSLFLNGIGTTLFNNRYIVTILTTSLAVGITKFVLFGKR